MSGGFDYALLSIPILIVIGFGLVWALLHRYFHSGLDKDSFLKDDLKDLSFLKGRLSEEEYRRVRQKKVEELAARSAGKGPIKKTMDTGRLEDELLRQQLELKKKAKRPKSGPYGTGRAGGDSQ
jgi:hypothetical protein